MRFGPGLGWASPGQVSLHGGGPGLRDEAERCGGVEAAYHQPLGQRGQRGVLCEAAQVHATQDMSTMFMRCWSSKINISFETQKSY